MRSRIQVGAAALIMFAACCLLSTCSGDRNIAERDTGGPGGDMHRFLVLDPGHFHAGLVFKRAGYDGISNEVGIYAPAGADYVDHMARVIPFNTRDTDPAAWRYHTYLGPDYTERMLDERAGDIVVLSGRNDRKIDRILACVSAGMHVLADKPWIIDAGRFPTLENALAAARDNGVIAYDIMTERYEITTILQRMLVEYEPVFGTLLPGSADNPAVVKRSVHHLFKYVAGEPLTRPAWFFDTGIQGEGMVDVTTHLVDLVFWTLYPDQPIDYTRDVAMISAEHWPTLLTPAQYETVTGQSDIPGNPALDEQGNLPYYCNGAMSFTLNGATVEIQVEWRFQAPEGAGDTHFSYIRGSNATVMVLQGAEQGYRPEVYVEPAPGVDHAVLANGLADFVDRAAESYPGIALERENDSWRIAIPDTLRIGHEEHFGQVTDRFLELVDGADLPEWETANMLAKYFITTSALEIAVERRP